MMMNLTTCLAVVLAIFANLIGGIANPVWYSYWDNTTAVTTATSAVGSINLTISTTTDSEATIYTAATNSSFDNPYIGLYNFRAAVNKKTMRAHYSFEFAIEPHLNAMRCNASAPAVDGKLVDIKIAKCWQPENWLPFNSYPMPAQFSFAWQNLNNSTVLVLRSTNPGSANACPNFPYDDCWAQGLYWVPKRYIKRKNGVEKYVGPGVIVLNGTYCKSGMKECAWSEYLY
ncbi:hypothetical protein VSDG_09208 [Cytospora chrysosperma]|uniref:Uncharacterized protein n=1 Tax=Cytospora chrysosperma TaxID=252740 RepID=A0A423VAP7_CYTCH|nr:hypothetical protein VSDG_09208 [Valsa sordida]